MNDVFEIKLKYINNSFKYWLFEDKEFYKVYKLMNIEYNEESNIITYKSYKEIDKKLKNHYY
jgi:hypothetical protein